MSTRTFLQQKRAEENALRLTSISDEGKMRMSKAIAQAVLERVQLTNEIMELKLKGRR
jgi:hypothetical protein